MHKKGFTLIEISIVLVIIGLLAGTVVVGKSLINSARVSNIIKEYQMYQTAALQFRQTYGELPGDFSNATNIISASRNGNGDELVTCDGGYYEFTDFFYHLGLTGMIEQKLTPVANDYSNIGRGTTLPSTDVIDNGVWLIKNILYYGTNSGTNVMSFGWGPDIAQQTEDLATDNYLILSRFENGVQSAYGVDVALAQAVDSKIDDKMPATGNVRVGNWTIAWHTGQGYNTDCISNFAAYVGYNTASRFGCVLVIKMKKK